MNSKCAFVSEDGYGNIFDACLAQSTQGLSVTNGSSIVAGFALMGTESSSTIMNSEASNAITNASGFTVPYGIYLEATINNPMTLTGYPAIPSVPGGSIGSADWSYDGQYLALAYESSEFASIYQYNRTTNIAQEIALPNVTLNLGFRSSWSHDNNYIAFGNIGGGSNPEINLFRFDRINTAFIRVDSETNPAIRGIECAW